MNATDIVGCPVTTYVRSACDATDNTAETWGAAGGNQRHASSQSASTRNEPYRIHRLMPSIPSPTYAIPRQREDTAWHTHPSYHHSGHHEFALKQLVGLDLFQVLPLSVVEAIPQLVGNR